MLKKSVPVTMLRSMPAAIMNSAADTTVRTSPIRNLIAMNASTKTTAKSAMFAKLMFLLFLVCLLMVSGNVFKPLFGT